MRDEIERNEGREMQRQTFINLITKKSHFDVLLEQVELQQLDAAAVESVELIEESDIDGLDDQEVDEIEESQDEWFSL